LKLQYEYYKFCVNYAASGSTAVRMILWSMEVLKLM